MIPSSSLSRSSQFTPNFPSQARMDSIILPDFEQTLTKTIEEDSITREPINEYQRKLKFLQVSIKDKDSQIKRLQSLHCHFSDFVRELEEENKRLRETLDLMEEMNPEISGEGEDTNLQVELTMAEAELKQLNEDIRVYMRLQEINFRQIKQLEQRNEKQKKQGETLMFSLTDAPNETRNQLQGDPNNVQISKSEEDGNEEIITFGDESLE